MRIENATYSITKHHQSLDKNFISIKKKQETEIGKNSIWGKGALNFFIAKEGKYQTLISR